MINKTVKQVLAYWHEAFLSKPANKLAFKQAFSSMSSLEKAKMQLTLFFCVTGIGLAAVGFIWPEFLFPAFAAAYSKEPLMLWTGRIAGWLLVLYFVICFFLNLNRVQDSAKKAANLGKIGINR